MFKVCSRHLRAFLVHFATAMGTLTAARFYHKNIPLDPPSKGESRKPKAYLSSLNLLFSHCAAKRAHQIPPLKGADPTGRGGCYVAESTLVRVGAYLIVSTIGIGLFAAIASANQPTLEWSYNAQSNLYPSPLVADVHPTPGLETIVSDSEVRTLRCIDSQGNPLWEYKGGWTRRLTSGASLSFSARAGKGTLLIGNADGKLCAVDAETGQELWTQTTGPIEWGAAIWADLDGDGADEAIAGTESAGVVALNANGDVRWTLAKADDLNLHVQGPIGAADFDSDGKAEIFVVDYTGPLCINPDGTVRWRRRTGDLFQGAPVVTTLSEDGKPVLLAVSSANNFLHCFDAADGTPLWKCGLIGASDVYPGASLAVGDLDGDGSPEIVVPDNEGHVHCITADGALAWIFTTDKATHGAVSLGDVDGDGSIEILIASGDHNLYCVDANGRLEWRYAANLRLIHPATIADMDGDNKTDILVCGSDRTLRCLTLGGRYDPALIPWPANRVDVALSGSTLGRNATASRTVNESLELVKNGDFNDPDTVAEPEAYPANSSLPEEAKRLPRDWHVETVNGATLRWAENGGRDNSACAVVNPAPAETRFATDPVQLERGVRSVTANVYAKANATNGITATLRWIGREGVMRADTLQDVGANDGWLRLSAQDAIPPREAEWVQFVCYSPSAESPVMWDDASLAAQTEQRPLIKTAVNQVGYEVGAPKRFTAWSNFAPDSNPAFSVVDDSGAVVYEGTLTACGRITGAYGHDWGFDYWRGDFSEFDAPGKYRIRVTMDSETGESWPFAIGKDVLWNQTAEPAYRFFYYQRCGMAIPGFHGACHLDDAVSPDGKRQYSLSGGWHDAGDYNTYNNAPYVYGLVSAYEEQQPDFDTIDRDGNGRSDFLDEILWGGDLMRRMVAPDGSSRGDITSGYGFWGPPELETDNIPNTGDERRIRGKVSGNDPANHMAAAAAIARLLEPGNLYLEAAQRAFDFRSQQGKRDAYQLSAALDLYALTKDDTYLRAARELLPAAGFDRAQVIEQYDAVTGENHADQIRDALVARANGILQLAGNPFGVYEYGSPDHATFFGTPPDNGGWHVGNSSHVLEAAHIVAEAYRYTADPRYAAFVYDQFNWILGNNPYDLCLMEGIGSVNPPSYHHRYAMAGVPRGAVPGSVVNGITWKTVGDDRPYFDMRGLDIPDFESNEVWLPHNTNYLKALVSLHRAQTKYNAPH